MHHSLLYNDSIFFLSDNLLRKQIFPPAKQPPPSNRIPVAIYQTMTVIVILMRIDKDKFTMVECVWFLKGALVSWYHARSFLSHSFYSWRMITRPKSEWQILSYAKWIISFSHENDLSRLSFLGERRKKMKEKRIEACNLPNLGRLFEVFFL